MILSDPNTMKVRVKLTYHTAPSDREQQTIRDAGSSLTSNRKSVSVQVLEKDHQYVVALEFLMPTQAQYKVVDRISDEVQRWLMEPYDDICISFGK